MAEYNPSKIIKDGNTYNFRDDTKIPLAGSNQISGDLIPSTDNSIDIGSSTKNIKALYTKGITIDGKTIDTDANDNMTYDDHIIDTIEEQGDGYIRYSNGLQICTGSVYVGNPAGNPRAFSLTFARSFTVPPVVTDGIIGGFSTEHNGGVEAIDTTSCSGFVLAIADSTFHIIAIGRWK